MAIFSRFWSILIVFCGFLVDSTYHKQYQPRKCLKISFLLYCFLSKVFEFLDSIAAYKTIQYFAHLVVLLVFWCSMFRTRSIRWRAIYQLLESFGKKSASEIIDSQLRIKWTYSISKTKFLKSKGVKMGDFVGLQWCLKQF